MNIFGKWEFYYKTSLAHVSFKQNKLLKTFEIRTGHFIFYRYRSIGQLLKSKGKQTKKNPKLQILSHFL